MSSKKITVVHNEDNPVLITNSTYGLDVDGEVVPHDCYTNESTKRKKQKLIVSERNNLLQVGSNFGDSAENSNVQYYVGVYNESTGLSLYSASFMKIQQTIPILESEEADKKSKKGMESRNLLGETFGTQKIKQQIKSIARNQIDVKELMPVAGVIQKNIDQKASTIPTEEDLDSEINSDRPIPPFDLEADKPDEIYPFNQLITPEEYEEIPYKKFLAAKSKDLEQLQNEECYGSYIMHHFQDVVTRSKKDINQIKRLMYLGYLIRFRDMRLGDLNNEDKMSAKLIDAPNIIKERFIELFTDIADDPKTGKKIRQISSKNKDKIVSYILVLCLYLEAFTLDPTLIAQDLKISKTKIFEFLKNLGCTIDRKKTQTDEKEKEKEDSASGDKVARLKAPLKFPKPKRFG